MAYVLENEKEFARLEDQSKTDLWSPERELSSFSPDVLTALSWTLAAGRAS